MSGDSNDGDLGADCVVDLTDGGRKLFDGWKVDVKNKTSE